LDNYLDKIKIKNIQEEWEDSIIKNNSQYFSDIKLNESNLESLKTENQFFELYFESETSPRMETKDQNKIKHPNEKDDIHKINEQTYNNIRLNKYYESENDLHWYCLDYSKDLDSRLINKFYANEI